MFEDEMLTIEDVASYLKLKPQTIYKWAQTGKIPGAKFGKEWRFRRSAIEAWIDHQMKGSPAGIKETEESAAGGNHSTKKPAAPKSEPAGEVDTGGRAKKTRRKDGSSAEKN